MSERDINTASTAEITTTNDDNEGGRKWEERAGSSAAVRKKLRNGWRNDDAVLDQYFNSCFANWKIYKGERTPKQVLKLLAIYKQAVYGDNRNPPPENLESAEGLKWQAWYRLRGMPSQMAKRRFITYLSEINPILIDVMPDEKPPPGFPHDRRGIPICAKCNTKVGCSRPLLDENKMNLKQQLFENEELHEPEKFKLWVRHVLENQRCVWGAHKPISRAEAKPFQAWFDKSENRGFYPYDSITVMILIRELVHYHHEIAWDMMGIKDEVNPFEYNAQSIRATKLRTVYEQLAGETFDFMVPCERDNDLCNQRRTADGGKNHTHAAVIDPPSATNQSTMEEAVELRKQCQQLGLNPTTGVVKDMAQRCDIYRRRIEQHFESLQKSATAKRRNEERAQVHAAEKRRVKQLSRNMLSKQCGDICQLNMVDKVLQIVHRGCNPNEESPRGFTPLICLVLNDAPAEKVEALLGKKANINYVNRFGFSALMLACRMNNTKMLHILMRNGVSALQKDDKIGYTALHWCAIHGCEEMVKIIVEYLQEGVGDSMRVTRFLDAQSNSGETALMVAAKHRNGIMAHLLTSVGANPNNRNNKGRTAAFLARSAHWTELADWLEKKVGAGMAKLATFSDLQFEKSNRVGLVKMRELIYQFGRTYLILMQNRIGLAPIGCPFNAKYAVLDKGDRAITEQRKFMDNHHFFILKRDVDVYNGGGAAATASSSGAGGAGTAAMPNGASSFDSNHSSGDHASVAELKELLAKMLALVRTGTANPNTETDPKPLPWSPLHCAVVMNDLRTIKLMMREGANPNHPNRDGTTPVMLAAQLQNVAALAELLLAKGDLEARDSQGYSVVSYATSLPLPSTMDRDVVGILMEGDTDGPKPMSSMDLIKVAVNDGLDDIKEAMEEHEGNATPAALDLHFRKLLLLEKYGLTSVLSERNVQQQVKTAKWRVKEPNLFRPRSSSSRERRNAIYYKRLQQATIAEEMREKKAQVDAANELRCPVCTLSVPCAHFFKVEVLEQFLYRKKEAEELALQEEHRQQESGEKKQYISARKLRIKNRASEILQEANLSDRNTDRSTKLVNEYRGREIDVDKAAQQREAALQQEAERIAEEELDAEEAQLMLFEEGGGEDLGEDLGEEGADGGSGNEDEEKEEGENEQGYLLENAPSTPDGMETPAEDHHYHQESKEEDRGDSSGDFPGASTGGVGNAFDGLGLDGMQSIRSELSSMDSFTNTTTIQGIAFQQYEQGLDDFLTQQVDEQEVAQSPRQQGDNTTGTGAMGEAEHTSGGDDATVVSAMTAVTGLVDKAGDGANEVERVDGDAAQSGVVALVTEPSTTGTTTALTPTGIPAVPIVEDLSTALVVPSDSSAEASENNEGDDAVPPPSLALVPILKPALKYVIAASTGAGAEGNVGDEDLHRRPVTQQQKRRVKFYLPEGILVDNGAEPLLLEGGPEEGNTAPLLAIEDGGAHQQQQQQDLNGTPAGASSNTRGGSTVSGVGGGSGCGSGGVVDGVELDIGSVSMLSQDDASSQSSDSSSVVGIGATATGLPRARDGGASAVVEAPSHMLITATSNNQPTAPTRPPIPTTTAVAAAAAAGGGGGTGSSETGKEGIAMQQPMEQQVALRQQEEGGGEGEGVSVGKESGSVDLDIGSFKTVSTSTTTTTNPEEEEKEDEDSSKNSFESVPEGAARDMHVMFQTGGTQKSTNTHDLVNPVPINDRRVYMFAKSGLARRGQGSNGLVHVPAPAPVPNIDLAAKAAALQARAEEEKEAALSVKAIRNGVAVSRSAEMGVGSGKAAVAAKKKELRAKREEEKLAQMRRVKMVRSEPLHVDISGWIFVSLADLKSDVNPLDSVSLSLVAWGSMLENVREYLMDEIIPQIRIEPVVSIKDWQSLAPRCSVCSVGFVRFKSSIESFHANPAAYLQLYGDQRLSRSSPNTNSVHLCLACAIRKELFSQSKTFFPPSFTAGAQLAWPYMHRRNVNASTLPEPSFSFMTGPTVNSAAAAVGGIAATTTAVSVAAAGEHGEDKYVHGEGGGGGSIVSGISEEESASILGFGAEEQHALGLLSPTSRQVAQSNSPVKSRHLQDLDMRESWERTYDPNRYAMQLYQGGGHDDDDERSQTADSVVSALSDTVAPGRHRQPQDGEEETQATISTASTLTMVKPTKKPKELAMVPYLISKGLFEEAERTLRITLGKHAVDEGEGLKLLISLLMLQAEMYKGMGLWPLALAIYFDCVDLTASLMGFHDDATYEAIALLVSCMRKMQEVHLAGIYVKSLCQMIERDSLKSMRVEMVAAIKERDSKQVQDFLLMNAVWTDRLKPEVEIRNPLQRRFQSVVGMGGFYSLLTAQDGFSAVARMTFYQYCRDLDPAFLGALSLYVEFCFRLRACDELQLFKYLVQQVIQKQLAKRLVETSELARLYRELTSKEHLAEVSDFLHYAHKPSILVFDALLKFALEKLLPVYRIFLLFDDAGSILRDQRVDIIAEAYDVSATIIQCLHRGKKARGITQTKREAFQQEQQRLEEKKAIQRKKAARY